jgi:ATP-dependent protease ClpP protease subunit
MGRSLVLFIVLFLAFPVYAIEGDIEVLGAEVEEQSPTYCPKTLISDNDKCLTCHVAPTFELREADPYAKYKLPWNTKIINGKLIFKLSGVVRSNEVQDAFEYLAWHPEFNEIIIEIHSPGGSLAEAWKIVSIMSEAQARGIKVTTKAYGFAASAAFVVFCAGDMGNRQIGRLAEIMHHELWTFTFLSIDTPSSKENEAKTLRHLQDTIHKWLLTRCTKEMTIDDLNDLVHHKDYWMNSQDAIEAGFADKYVGE